MEGLGVTADWSGRTAFVTGAYGLLGSWLVKALLAGGARVIVLKHDEATSALVLDGSEDHVTVVRGDCLDGALLAEALRTHDVDTVFHLAAQTIVGTAHRSPAATFDTNIRGTWTVLDACLREGVAGVVVASSDKAYGGHDELPYREELALRAQFPYDVSKAAADMVARCYAHTYELPVAVTRFANLYGGGDLNHSRLVPEVVSAVIQGRAPIIRSDGSPERDYLYAEDAARAYLDIAAALDRGEARGEAFNAGGGRPHSVREVVDLVCRVAGVDLTPEFGGGGTPEGEIDRQYVDAAKLTALTGWTPRVSLEDGLGRTVEWYREHPEALVPVGAAAPQR
jgi:CDP-glucose 4,6-dehydratase